jgi:hypothetical protein
VQVLWKGEWGMRAWKKMLMYLLAQLREIGFVADPDLSIRRKEFIDRILLIKAGRNGK